MTVLVLHLWFRHCHFSSKHVYNHSPNKSLVTFLRCSVPCVLALKEIAFILRVATGSLGCLKARHAWHWSSHIPRDSQNNITKWGKHGERRGGQKTPLSYLVFGRPGVSVPGRNLGAGLRGPKPGARPAAWASSGLAIAVWAPAAVGAEAAGLGEAVVQHLCRPDTQHFILVNVEFRFSAFSTAR